jgi:integrase
MAILHRLTQTDLKRHKPGMYGDGGGLWLQITTGAAGHANRSWLFRFAIAGKRREMGLGPTHIVGLREARERATELRRLVYEGVDPIERRNADRATQAAATARTVTFDECVAAYAKAHSAKWSAKHAMQWSVSLAKHASPIFGKLPVQEVDTTLVIKALEKIWHSTPETAARTRQRIEAVLAWATVRGYRSGDNPARWTNHLSKLLPSRRELQPGKHFAAMPYRDVPALVTTLRQRGGHNEKALELIILTACRRGEVLGARWDEIDLASKTWLIPPERMKSGKAHRVPLSDRAVAIIKDMQPVRRNEYVFPGVRSETITETPLRELLIRLDLSVTIHGFRSSFRDWCAEQTNFPRELAEQALAHAVGDSVERAYARTDMLAKRRRLMAAWADYCSKPIATGATVTRLRKDVADA